jgi:hypothetical protein
MGGQFFSYYVDIRLGKLVYNMKNKALLALLFRTEENMKTTNQKYFLKNIIVQVGAVVAIVAVGFFMHAMSAGGLSSAVARVRQLAQLSNVSLSEVDLVPMPYDAPLCAAGALPVNMMIILSKPDAATVYIIKDQNTAASQPAKLNAPFYLEKGSYRLYAKLNSGYSWSGRSQFSFTIDKACDGGVLATTNPPLPSASSTIASTTDAVNSNGGYSTTTAGTLATTSATVPNQVASTTPTLSTTTAPVPAPIPVPVVDTVFSVAKNYPTDGNIVPMILKDNVRTFTGVGQVTFQVELPSDNAYILVGSPDGWTSGGVFGVDRGLKRVSGTQRWVLQFDTKQFKDGDYRVGAAYFVRTEGWKYTSAVDFPIKNIVVVPVPVPVATSSAPVATSAEQYVPTWKSPTSTNAAPEAKFVPTLRLVVDDHQVTALGRMFDRELLEVRATTLPAQSVQFLALSLDGAFKPAIKELGKGGRDELLSRDGKEVWTYSIDMGEFPSGNYRLFARIRTLANTVEETAPSSISVQHLNQLVTNPNPSLSVEDTPPATATREQILQRVQDPSTCQNRQECQVFCSSSKIAQEKCANFARVEGMAGYNLTTVLSDVVKLQDSIRGEFSGKLAEYIARASYTGTTSPTVVASDTVAVAASSSWAYSDSVGRPSLADVLPKSVIDATVANPLKLASELPADVHTADDFQSYCGTIEHAERCTKIITNIAPDLSSVIKKQEEIVQRTEQHQVQVIEQRTGARIFTDTDNDGISDYDEINIFHTDPTKRDTYNTGYSDGATLLSQSSGVGQVAGATTSASIALAGGLAVENPKLTGTTQANIMNVGSVSALELKETDGGKKDIAKALFKGKALPNSFVKIYLFSDPIVVTVKTDDQGNWSYILDKTLPDGAHTAYVAMVDNGGRILAKSAPLPFVKEASALTVEAAGLTPGAPVEKGMFSGLTPLALIALVVGVLGLGLSVIGAVIGIRHSKQSSDDAGLGVN